MKYETRKPSELSPFANNARTHTPEQIEKIAASIREFGFINPIIIDKDNGLIAGYGRLMAAQLLGLESVPVLSVEHLTDAQKRAYIIADNRLAEIGTDWDLDLLRQELVDLGDLGVDLRLTGFDLEQGLLSGPITADRADVATSPWDMMGKEASEGVSFTFGAISAKLPLELAVRFEEAAPELGIKEWLEELLNDCLRN